MADNDVKQEMDAVQQENPNDFYGGHVVDLDAAAEKAASEAPVTEAPVAEEPAQGPEEEAQHEPTKAEKEQKAVKLDRERRAQNVERLRREREREARLQENQRFMTGIKAIQESQRRKRICQGTIGAVVTKTADGSPANDEAQ